MFVFLNIINGVFFFSLSESFFMLLVDCVIKSLLILVELVNESLCIVLFFVSICLILIVLFVIICNKLLGIFVCCVRLVKVKVVNGVFGVGFKIIV